MSTTGIRCPVCGFGGTKVLETRAGEGTLRRRRACEMPGCKGRVTTIEMVIPTMGKRAKTAKMGRMIAVPAPDNKELVVVPKALCRRLYRMARRLNERVARPPFTVEE